MEGLTTPRENAQTAPEATSVQKLRDEYRRIIDITPQERADSMKNGRLLPIGNELMDPIIKENYYLEIAIKDPEGYIKERAKRLFRIRDEVNKEYLKTFREYKKDLPAEEAKKLAMSMARAKEELELLRLETLYPTKFGDVAYSKAIQDQVSTRQLQFSNNI